MGGYRRDVVHRVLSERGAVRVVSSPDSERWRRSAEGEDFEAVLAFTRDGDLLYGDEVRYPATGLGLDADDVIRRVDALGGLWRRPGR